MPTVKSSIFLPAAQKEQLAAMKAANATALKSIDARISTTNTQKSAVVKLSGAATQLRTDLDKLSSAVAGGTGLSEAVSAFVKDYNSMLTSFNASTGKGAVLAGASDVKQAGGAMRQPFLDMDVLGALKSLGVTTTKDGLAVTGTPAAGVDLSAVTAAFQGTLTRVDTRLGSATSRFDGAISRLQSERTRASDQVDRANARTESSFMKMYTAMQAYQQAQNNGGSTLNLFA